MSVVAATERDLDAIRDVDAGLAGSALAALALALAAEIDDASNSATSKSMCAARLIDALDVLRALTPAREEGDHLDDLASRRARRIAVGAAAAEVVVRP